MLEVILDNWVFWIAIGFMFADALGLFDVTKVSGDSDSAGDDEFPVQHEKTNKGFSEARRNGRFKDVR